MLEEDYMDNIFQYLEKTKGKKIPLEYKLLNNIPLTKDELTIDSYLNLSNSKIDYLPDNLIVNGYLNLRNSNITHLPDNLTLKGGLYIGYSEIYELPNNLIVNGDLHIAHSNISELPDDFYVGGDLICYGTPLADRIENDLSLLNKYSKQVKGRIFYEY